LGLVLYRHGRYAEAREALLQAQELATRESAHTLLSLAMVSWQLGREVEARGYYDRAVARIEEDSPKDPELSYHRREAARLLGVGS
jgi:tetratricopeptide (TPR) repeat protein